MRFVSGDELDKALTFETLIEALRAGHAGQRAPLEESIIGDASAKYFVRSTGVPGAAFGSKLITVFPDNEQRSGLPSVQAVFVLFDGTTGALRGLLDGTALTYWKTAADSGLGTSILARKSVERLLMVGAGRMAKWLIRAHRTARPGLRTVRLWNRTSSRAEALAEELRSEDIDARVADGLEDAVGGADVICTATMSEQPLIRGEWLSPGTHLDLVGGWTPDMREADDAAVGRSRVFVDNRESAFAGVGDILSPIANGVITKDDILGDHYDLVGGGEGRTSDDDITLFKNAGGAHLDLMTAEAALAALDDRRAS